MKTVPRDLDVYVLAGQSNMQGCGLLNGALEADERVWSLSSAGSWEVAQEPLHRLWESFAPVHQALMREGIAGEDTALSDAEMAAREAQSRLTGAGLGLAFGRAMAKGTGRAVGLIPAAHGGTSLYQWSAGGKAEGTRSLYGAMLERIRRAGGSLRGVLWYQGESDAYEGAASTYGQRLGAWIEALRADVEQPELAVLAVQIGRVVQPPQRPEEDGWKAGPWDQVREALRLLPSRVPHAQVTSAIDLGMVDFIHIDTPGLIRLGERLARLAASQPAPQLRRLHRQPHPLGLGWVRVHCDGVSGGWNGRGPISGFEVRDADGQAHPEFYVVDARADEDDPDVIRVLLNSRPDESARLGYGLGLNPICNAVDGSDMPLCAFAPQAIED